MQNILSVLVSAAVLSTGLALAGAAQAENVLRWTSQGDALTLDPHSQNEGPTNSTNGIIYESLVTRGPTLELQPELAESWSAEADGWTFNLRKGVTFHDGAEFTAEDVAFSIARAQADSSDFKKRVKTISGVQIVDDHTVKLLTEAPNPILPNEITSVYIMDKGWAEANNVVKPQDYDASQETFSVRNANGTGPFKLISRAPDELSVFEANVNWWGKGHFPGNIDRIEYRPISNASTRVASLLSGEVEFVLDPSVQDVSRIDSAEGLTIKTIPQIRSIFFGLNQGADELASSNVKGANPFKDPNVRMAINLAIDKKAIQRVIMNDLSSPTGLITPPGVHGNTPELDASYGHDLEKAKALMAEAGYGDGFTVQLDCPNNRYVNDEKICQAVVSMLAKIGMTVKLEATPKAQHFPKIKNRTTDFYLLGWGVPTLDSHYVFDFLIDSDGSWNATGYNNTKVNGLIAAIGAEIDHGKRTQMIVEVWEIAKAEAPYVPIHHQVLAWGMAERLDMPISADDQFRPRYAVLK